VNFTRALKMVQHSSKTSDLTLSYFSAYVLQKRALRLQQAKQKAALHREQQRELQLQRETDLIAKPVSSYSEKERSS